MAKVNAEMVNAFENAFRNAHSWNKAVLGYACDMLEELQENDFDITEENLLNGASDWKEYSYGGSAFAYNADIENYFTTECNCVFVGNNDTWMDIQAKACKEAAKRIISADYAVNGY